MGDEHEREAEALIRRGGDAAQLAAELAKRARTPYAVAARLLGDPDDSARAVADKVLAGTEELAIEAIASRRGLPPLDRGWAIQRVVREELSLRRDVILWLAPMLRDKAETGEPATAKEGEPKPAPRRVCDEAFLLLQKLGAFEEKDLAKATDPAAFDALAPAQRDGKIAAALRSTSMKRIKEMA